MSRIETSPGSFNQSFKNPISWNVEVGSPREFFREMQDLFLTNGYSISETKEPTLTGTAMENVAEFDGYLVSSDTFGYTRLPILIAGLVTALVSAVLFLPTRAS